MNEHRTNIDAFWSEKGPELAEALVNVLNDLEDAGMECMLPHLDSLQQARDLIEDVFLGSRSLFPVSLEEAQKRAWNSKKNSNVRYYGRAAMFMQLIHKLESIRKGV